MKKWSILLLTFCLLSCENQPPTSYLISGTIVDGSGAAPFEGHVWIDDDRIAGVFASDQDLPEVDQIIDAKGQIISPGFIDPHTHAWHDLEGRNPDNLNYLYQGVTTVMCGNDGRGPIKVDSSAQVMLAHGIGTNAAFMVGHATVRSAVLGDEDVQPDSAQMETMRRLLRSGLSEGAFGLSAGLYYAPGSFAKTEEVIELAKVASEFDVIYESHIRDESTYNIGLLAAVKEAIEIGEKGGIPTHLAHLKALGVDVWNYSDSIIAIVEAAQARGHQVTADQYPWRASGTNTNSALLDRWVLAGGKSMLNQRLDDSQYLDRITGEIKENIRRRGGPESLLITARAKDSTWIGKTIGQLAKTWEMAPEEAALHVIRNGGASLASFNMQPADIKKLMVKDWVMTCSDGSTGHPRKYASYPKKYQDYVLADPILTLESFVYKSSFQVAQTLKMKQRGLLAKGYFADLIIFDPSGFKPMADFETPTELAEGIKFVWVNGKLVISQGQFLGERSGRVLKRVTSVGDPK